MAKFVTYDLTICRHTVLAGLIHYCKDYLLATSDGHDFVSNISEMYNNINGKIYQEYYWYSFTTNFLKRGKCAAVRIVNNKKVT